MATKDGMHRILRVGIIQGGKIVEERLLRKRESVTIGQAPRNTFIIPIASLPKTYTLFEVKQNKYALIFNSVMDGRVSAGDEIVDLKGLAKSGGAQKRGAQYVLDLTDKSRGKVVIGDITLLFQFVEAPPVLPKPQLPQAARGGLQLDWAFTYITIVAFLLMMGSGVGADVWWRLTGQYLEESFSGKSRVYDVLRAEVKKQKEKKKEEEEKKEEKEAKPDEAKVEKPAEDPVEAPKEDKKPKVAAKPETASSGDPKEKASLDRNSERFRRTAERVRGKTLLSVLGSNAEGGDGAGDLSSELSAGKLNDAFALGDGGVAMAKPGEKSGFDGSAPEIKVGTGTYKKLDPGATTTRIATKTVTTEKKDETAEVKIRLNISGQTSGQTGTGKIDKDSVSGVFSRRVGAIKYCYESALKSNPSVKGKIQIRFTIGTAGRITGATVASNTTGDSAVGNCIIEKLRSWKFPPAEGGDVTFTHTFVLSSG